MEKQRFNVHVNGKLMPWSTGTAVRDAKGFVFLTGTVGMDLNTGEVAKGAYAQTKVAMEEIKRRLEGFGTSLENICHIRYDVVGPDFPDGVRQHPTFQERTRALREFWQENCPEFLTNPTAATAIGVAALGTKEMLLEITVIAAIP